MPANLYWVAGPWPGKLGLAARPRGGEWLKDEVSAWKKAGIHTVLSLLTSDEERTLDLASEEQQVKAQGIRFLSFPIPDRQVPESRMALSQTLETVERDLASGNNVLLHCRQGIGRTGLVAAALLLTKGFDADLALRRITEARGIRVPETAEQLRWIEQFASALAGTHSDD